MDIDDALILYAAGIFDETELAICTLYQRKKRPLSDKHVELLKVKAELKQQKRKHEMDLEDKKEERKLRQKMLDLEEKKLMADERKQVMEHKLAMERLYVENNRLLVQGMTDTLVAVQVQPKSVVVPGQGQTVLAVLPSASNPGDKQ